MTIGSVAESETGVVKGVETEIGVTIRREVEIDIINNQVPFLLLQLLVQIFDFSQLEEM